MEYPEWAHELFHSDKVLNNLDYNKIFTTSVLNIIVVLL